MTEPSKLKMHSLNKVDENIQNIARLFPNCLTERKNDKGELEQAIDFDMLKQELSSVIVDGRDERYQFTWPDKKKSILLANAPIAKTLRPCKEESLNFDTTQNLYIEGDNLEVLKLLQETYLGKVKMIYIDPPYNTGNDFVYEDDFAMRADEYMDISGDYDDEGNRLVKNLDSNGRFHTDWLNMIYPRLKLAKDLLSDDGVIFISIDDNEQSNLKKLCDEVFGEGNFVANFIWKKKGTSTNVANSQVSALNEHILCYSKTNIPCLNRRKTSVEDRTYPFNDNNGKYRTTIIEKKDSGTYSRATMKYPILNIYPRQGKRWQIGEKTARDYEKKERFINDNGIIKLKIYDFEDSDTYSANPNLLLDYGNTDSANKSVNKELFNQEELFSNPKPLELIKHLVNISSKFINNDIILDFFSGSATTAHAVMQLNAEDGGNRKFIMVQIPEVTDEKSEAYKAGYKNICEIGKERIRRAGVKIQEEQKAKKGDLFADGKKPLDTGFRVLKCDSTNMKEVYYTPKDYAEDPELFDKSVDNIKADRTPEDLLFQVMLELGILLSSNIEETTIAGKKVFSVDGKHLIACFDTEITDEVVTQIAQKKPHYAIFCDKSFASDDVGVNFEQIFEAYSKDTVRKVL